MEPYETFIEKGMKEASGTVEAATLAATEPFAIIYERISPLVKDMLFRKIVRPLMSPRRVRYA
jgi:hypothetical protein